MDNSPQRLLEEAETIRSTTATSSWPASSRLRVIMVSNSGSEGLNKIGRGLGPLDHINDLHPALRERREPGGLPRAAVRLKTREPVRDRNLRGEKDCYFRFGGRTHHAGEYQNYVEYFARCLASGETPRPDAREGVVTIALLQAMEESCVTGRPVRIAETLARHGLASLLDPAPDGAGPRDVRRAP